MFLLKIVSLIISIYGVYLEDSIIDFNEMTTEMKNDALATALEATLVLPDLNAFANRMANEFNRKYGESWQCIASDACNGSVISSNITHVSGTLISFTVFQTRVILFQSHSVTQERVDKEIAFTEQTFECYTNRTCSLILVKKAFIERRLSAYSSNFIVQGENPGKIIADQPNETGVQGKEFLLPAVEQCVNRTTNDINHDKFGSTFAVINSVFICIEWFIERNVNETIGWQYLLTLGKYRYTYLWSDQMKYGIDFDYETISLFIHN